MHWTRRDVLRLGGVACATSLLIASRSASARDENRSATVRQFHVCLSYEALDHDPDLLKIVREAGVSHVWLGGFMYGFWPSPIEHLREWRKRVEAEGMQAHGINLPLGHPGDSLGAKDGAFPLTPPKHWQRGTGVDGANYAGTSLHPPATDENCAAMRLLEREGIDRVFLDDDFRLARSPGVVGGCFCAEHRKRFLLRQGLADASWDELLQAVRTHRRTPLLDVWVDFTCDELSAAFRAMQAAAPKIKFGPMVMYLGAEKAGIRLADYADVPLRVGELMFDDGSFSSVKGKTNELFSALFHRRFVAPERAYSESTAYPATALSATNMAAKLNVSTIADVRHTMFMSGITPFPRTHWATLGPRMKRAAEAHAILAGHKLQGPFKHLWTDDDRRVGDDNPYSLFLATGVPFEVTETPSREGFTFLSTYGARAATESRIKSAGTTFVFAPGAVPESLGRKIPESLDGLFALKHEVMKNQPDVPVVLEDTPVVCAWYPTARSVCLWNLTDTPQPLTLRCGSNHREVRLEALDISVLRDIG